jgi:hypothetical protein
MANERVVVVKERKRGGFWPFVGGMVLGAIAIHMIGEQMNKKKVKQDRPSDNIVPEKEIKNSDEITMVEDLINELTSKPHKTTKDKNNIDLLRIKLKQLRGY